VSVELPPLPEAGVLADFCREASAVERLPPQLIEKDFFLTRVLWAFGQHFGEQLLLKGGTLLSKADLGFFRMSEDADFIIASDPADLRKLARIRAMEKVRDALKQLAQVIGVTVPFPGGTPHDRHAHYIWQLDYRSDFGKQGIKLEVSLRPRLRPARKVALKQLLTDPLAGDYSKATCFALDAAEARAEKVRAAFDREAIRDFYDLDRLLEEGYDFSSPEFARRSGPGAIGQAAEGPWGERPSTGPP
jgi:predicted nucleotidyltransferase component of viral defense system